MRYRGNMLSAIMLAAGFGLQAGPVTNAWAQDAALNWQDSAKILAAEKQRAETCVSILKRHTGGNAAVLSRGQIAYSEAKAEADAAIAGLTMALAQGEEVPVSLVEIEKHLALAGDRREEFCAFTVSHIPVEDGASKQVMPDVLSRSVTALINAARDIYLNYRKENILRREGISLQVEAKKWRDFEDIPG